MTDTTRGPTERVSSRGLGSIDPQAVKPWLDPLADDLGPDPVTLSVMRHGHDALDVFALMIQRPDWHARAACRGRGPAEFFPTLGQSTDAAKAICATCSATAECLDASEGERGIWAGLSAVARREKRRPRPLAS